jgi:hypothetical protein
VECQKHRDYPGERTAGDQECDDGLPPESAQ